MRRAVRDFFFDFNVPFEGYTDWLYLDVKGLVTTGVGNLVDPMSLAIHLPWMTQGRLATAEEIGQAWRTVKLRQDLKMKGGGAFKSLTNLRLQRVDVDMLVKRKMFEMAGKLRERFPAFDTWPADAQLGTMSMAWAMGPAFKFPKFARAANEQDFATCARECTITGGGTIRDRNAANVVCFENAARVIAHGLDPDVLLFGSECPDGVPTQREIPEPPDAA